ncbi:MAG: beta strand repeat-containing protein [Candidatus Saccharimonadales bacterium]
MAQTIQVGNTTGTTSLALQGGTGGVNVTGALTANNNVTIGASAGSGTVFTNNGATVNSAYAMADLASGGWDAGGAGTTVDKYTYITANQTTASQALTVPAPTTATAGRLLYISNIGTASFTFTNTYLTATLKPGATATLIWTAVNGVNNWTYAGADGSGILNQTTQQTSANFNIDGTGKAAGFDATSGALAIGGTTATSITVGNTANTASWLVQGTNAATYTIGTSTHTGSIVLGNSQSGETVGIATGANTSGTNTVNIAVAAGNGGTAAINIGTSATAGSTSNITIGSTVAGTTTLQSAGGTTANYAGTGNALTVAGTGNGTDLNLTSNAATTASLLNISQSTAAYTGTAIKVNIANGSGSFASGKFIDLQNNGSSKFSVDANGVVTLAGGQTADITTSGATTLKADTGGAAAITLGGTNANAINIGHANIATTITGTGTVTNSTATTGSLLSITQNTTAFTGTGILVNLANGSGTFSSGKLIDLQNNGSSKFNVDNTGKVTLIGGQTADITTSGATTLKLDTGGAAAITIGGSNASGINIGNNNITTAITGVASITNTSASTSLSISTNTTPTTAAVLVTDTSGTSTDKLLSLKLGANEVFGVDAAGNVKVLPGANIDTNAAGTLNFGTANASTINIGKTTGAGAQTINIGTNSTAGSSLVIGSTTSGTTTLQSAGGVLINTAVFTTSSGGASADANCFTGGAVVHTSCTITSATVAAYSAVVVGFDQSGQVASLPDPAGGTPAGRVIYVTAANGSSDFTLRVNGGGTGNDIAMRQNTTATMIWNGADWTAAGASSSTTLQAAYDNTLTSAGGAELVLSNTSNHNGLTIRDSATASVGGTLLEVQNSSAASVLSVNANVTDYANNGGAESTFASDWSLYGTGGISRNTSTTYVATGTGSVNVSPTAANSGVKNTLTSTLTANQHYNVSFAAKLDNGASGAFTDLNVYYSKSGSALDTACTNYSTQTIPRSVWVKVNCTLTVPASGATSTNAIAIVQAASNTRTWYVDNLSVTIAADLNYATDGGVDNNANFTTNWPTLNSATVTRDTSTGNDTSDSAKVVTTATANMGIKNALSINPLPSTLYRISVYAKLNSGTFNDFTVAYSPDDGGTGGANLKTCTDYNTQTLTTTGFTQITCYVTTGSTSVSAPRVYFYEPSATAQTFWVDTFSMTLASSNTPNVQIGGGVTGGPTTLLTLDRAASAPIAANNDALLGSMYYDTTQGKIQCYQASGWGSCGAASDTIVTISPEYTNAVFHAPSATGLAGVGTFTSDFCSDPLHINNGTYGDAICSTNETYNYYRWTSPQATPQTYGIYVTYQLPSTFKSFTSGSTAIMGRTDSGSSGGAATVTYNVYKSNSSGLTSCGSVSVASGTSASWQPGTATGTADPSTCGFSAGDKILFEIDVTANKDAKAYVGNLGFTFSNK